MAKEVRPKMSTKETTKEAAPEEAALKEAITKKKANIMAQKMAGCQQQLHRLMADVEAMLEAKNAGKKARKLKAAKEARELEAAKQARELEAQMLRLRRWAKDMAKEMGKGEAGRQVHQREDCSRKTRTPTPTRITIEEPYVF